MKSKLSKSWIVTLLFVILTAILPIINDPLEEEFGIRITEAELTHFLVALGLTSGAGVINSTRKGLQKSKVSTNPSFSDTERESAVVATTTTNPFQYTTRDMKKEPTNSPKLIDASNEVVWSNNDNSWYQTNFVQSPSNGNGLKFGQSYLWIKVPNTRSYTSVKLMTENRTALQIDQSHELDEDHDVETTRIELFSKDGSPLPKGNYVLQIQADVGTSDAQGANNDKFAIF